MKVIHSIGRNPLEERKAPDGISIFRVPMTNVPSADGEIYRRDQACPGVFEDGSQRVPFLNGARWSENSRLW